MKEMAALKTYIAVASLLALAFSGNAVSAKASSKSDSKPSTDVRYDKILRDGYFSKNQCDAYIEKLALPEQGIIKSGSRVILVEDNLVYITGGKSTATGDFVRLFRSSGLTPSPALLGAKEKLGTEDGYITKYSNDIFSQQKLEEALNARVTVQGNYAKKSEQREGIDDYLFCKVAENVLGRGEDADTYRDYIAYASLRVATADIGYFNISADSSYYGKSVNTGNKFAEPKKWEGSRFFVIRASFKNLDTESRVPVAGSLFINYNGKDYEFDSVEPIMLEGYNIWLKKVNPLITMKTKIVYRIPDEIHGEVFWRPGRNPSDTKLWLGFIKAAKPN